MNNSNSNSSSSSNILESGVTAIKELNDGLDRHDSSRKEVQEAFSQKINELKEQIVALEDAFNEELNKVYCAEDERLQLTVNELMKRVEDLRNATEEAKVATATATDGTPEQTTSKVKAAEEEVKKWTQKAHAELLVEKTYKLAEGPLLKEEEKEEDKDERKHEREGAEDDDKEKAKKEIKKAVNLRDTYRLDVINTVSVNRLHVESRSPPDIEILKVQNGRVYYKISNFLGEDEHKVIKEYCGKDVCYDLMIYEKSNPEDKEATTITADKGEEGFADLGRIKCNEAYCLKARGTLGGNKGKWGKATEFTSSFSECCRWTNFDKSFNKSKRYIVDPGDPRVVTTDKFSHCTVTGNTILPLNAITSWNTLIQRTHFKSCQDFYAGVAPTDINMNELDTVEKCGWYFDCHDSKLWSGPPHNYSGKRYGPKSKGGGQYVHTGDSVGVVMDTIKGELSFVVNGVNLGVAYDGIPLDKPLVPCIYFKWEKDTYKIVPTVYKETTAKSTIPVPSNITAKSITWDSITLSWDAVKKASSYQIEVDGSVQQFISTNTFTKTGLLAGTEHSFRVRAVCGNEVSEWSDAVKGRTQKESFDGSWWKECPDYVDDEELIKYSVDENNPRIATKIVVVMTAAQS